MPWLLYQTHSSSISGFCCFQQAHEGEFPWKGLGCFEIFCSQSLLQELNKLQQAREAEVLSWWNSAKFWWFSNVFKLEIRPYAVHSTNPTSGSQAVRCQALHSAEEANQAKVQAPWKLVPMPYPIFHQNSSLWLASMDRPRGNDVLSIKVYQGDAPTCPIEDILMKKYNFWLVLRKKSGHLGCKSPNWTTLNDLLIGAGFLPSLVVLVENRPCKSLGSIG